MGDIMQIEERKLWHAPVLEQLSIPAGTEGNPGDDGPGGDDFVNS